MRPAKNPGRWLAGDWRREGLAGLALRGEAISKFSCKASLRAELMMLRLGVLEKIAWGVGVALVICSDILRSLKLFLCWSGDG